MSAQLPRTNTGRVSGLNNSVEELNRRRPNQPRRQRGQTITFSKDGALAVTTLGTALVATFDEAVSLYEMALIRNAGISSTVLRYYRDGVQMGGDHTFNVNLVVVRFAIPTAVADFAPELTRLQVVVVTAGTAASGLVVKAKTWAMG